MKNYIKAKDGATFTFDVLEWFNEGWEFGHPTVMLRPIIRIEHDHGAETLIENVCCSLACGDTLDYIDDFETRELHWRGWDIKRLRRRFNEVLMGKKFPKAGFRATRKVVKFLTDEDGFTWEEAKRS